jgi:hypothetical protein
MLRQRADTPPALYPTSGTNRFGLETREEGLSGPSLSASVCQPGRRQLQVPTPTIQYSIRLRRAEYLESLAMVLHE